MAKGVRVTDEEWDKRAAAADIRWLERPANARTPTPAECIKPDCRHRFTPLPSNVPRQGCPACGRERQRASHRRSLESWNTDARKLGWEFTEQPVNVNTPAPARCLDPDCGATFDYRPSNINNENKCPRCAAARRAGETRGPHKRRGKDRKLTQEEWDTRAATRGFIWLEKVRRSDIPTKARCLEPLCSHEWLANPGTKSGCPRCATQRSADKRRMTQDEWDARAQRCNMEWLEPVKSSKTKTRARCLDESCGAEWGQWPNDLVKRPDEPKCPACAARRVAEKNRAPMEVRQEEARKVGCKWLEPVTRVGKSYRARCLKESCGFEWDAWPEAFRRGSGCPVCAEPWFKPNLPSNNYVVVNPDKSLVKVGKMNSHSPRLDQHRRDGFTEVVWFSDEVLGREATQAETSALQEIASRGLTPARGKEYFRISPDLLVADAIDIMKRAFDNATHTKLGE